MAKIPERINTVQNLIDAHHESLENKPRPHLGCSMLGHPCDRWLWLSFRWAVQPVFPGRILRLFRRGHREEETIIDDLRAIGVNIVEGEQSRVDFGSHVSGSVDAIINGGVPQAQQARHIGEFKTHSLKSFNDVSTKGVQKSKPEHYAQMQVYMHGTGINRALYVAVCKDNDSLYTERVRYDAEFAAKLVERGKRIALDDRMPPPISTDASWYQCKFCPAHSFCHDTKTTKHANCRTCAHSTAMPNSTWRCERFEADDIPVEYQHEGCEQHILHPDLVPWKMKESPYENIAIYEIDGQDVANGSPDGNVFSSKEILANPEGCANEVVRKIRGMWPGAEVVR
jgi:hypothetical protein